MKKFLKILDILFIVLILAGTGFYVYLSKTFPKVGPVRDMKVEITPERVERGKYLVDHVTGCIGCHSQRDFNYFSGPIVPGSEGKGGEVFDESVGFPGSFYSKNITPAGIGNWTDGELFRAVTTGINKDGKALFPLMPYLHFGQMDEDDILCVIAYIRTLKPITNDVPESKPSFPMSLIMRTIPQDAHFTKRPDRANIKEYGKYLVDVGSCIECHTQMNRGKLKEGFEYGGSREFPLSGGCIVRSSNITPDNETGIGLWTKEQFVNRFKAYDNPLARNVPVKPGEFNTWMPWTELAGMTSEDLEAIYTYLKTIPAVRNKVEKFSLAGIRN
jgi:hypothetical protein